MEKPSCKYCGCQNINCLACCSKTGLFFCNGKGDTNQSHILHHLQTMNFNEITLPEENRYHSTPFKCYVCDSTNIFKLGFMTNIDNSVLYIVCNSKCRDQLFKIEENIQDFFQPLISDGYIYPEVVSIPDSSEYKKIPFSRVLLVCQEIQEKIGVLNKAQRQLQSVKLQYQSRQEFTLIQTGFINNESEETKKIELLHFKNIKLTWKDGFHCQLKAPPRLFQISRTGNFLKFQTNSENENESETGYISKKYKNFFIDVTFDSTSLYVMLSKSNKIELQVSIQYKPTRFELQKSALDTFLRSENCMNRLIGNIILGDFSEISNSNQLTGSIHFCEPRSSYFPQFDPIQIKRMKTALSQRFSLINAPPGTGKTTMIAALVYSLVRAGIKPVLVCSQTEEAVNVATLTIAKTGLKVLRFASSIYTSFGPKIDKYLTAQIALNNFRDISSYSEIELLNEKERQNIEKYELKIIQNCDVLCATCEEIGDKKLLIDPPAQFCAIIVDECCSITDASLMIPIVKNCQQLIMFGDTIGEIKPPICSDIAKNARFDLSLMERLMLLGMKPYLLSTQFRMHPELAKYPSKIFYGNFLKTKFNEKISNAVKNAIIWPNPDFPSFFWNVKSNEEKTNDGFSYKNDQELNQISILLNSMLSKGIQKKEIGIISPYIGQKQHLIDKLPELLAKNGKEKIDDIEIGTVEDFQGKEKNLIIISLVRANKEFDIGILNQKNNFCILLTRARCGLVIIGCAETFSKNKMWCRYIQYCKEKSAFVEGELDSLKNSEFNQLIELDEDCTNDYN